MNILETIHNKLKYFLVKYNLFGFEKKWTKINIGSGSIKIDGYCNLDIDTNADICLDLEKTLLPFQSKSIETAVCISVINYFSRERAQEIINDTYRILKRNGVARFATQDLRSIVKKYINNDKEFFFQKLPNGKQRFHGKTMADKINSWFYGYKTTGGKLCKYFYDYETLELMFKEAGFKKIQNKKYMESVITEIKFIDNRQEQMFFLEAIK